jgi:hypothetical protein
MSGLKTKLIFVLLIAFFITGCGGGGGGGGASTGTVVITVTDTVSLLVLNAPVELWKTTTAGPQRVYRGTTGATGTLTLSSISTGDYQAYYVPADNSGSYPYPDVGVKTVLVNTANTFPIRLPDPPPSPPTE